MRKIILFIFLSVSMKLFSLEKKIVVEWLNGTEKTSAISNVGRIVINEGDLLLLDLDDVLLSSGKVRDVRKISFVNADTQSKLYCSGENIIVYPNPAEEFVYVENLKDESVIMLYNQFGQLLIEVHSDKVDVRTLPKGVYFLRVESEIFRIIKK